MNFSETSVATRRKALEVREFMAYKPAKFKSASIVASVVVLPAFVFGRVYF